MRQDNSRSDTKEEKTICKPADIAKETIQAEAWGGKKDKIKKG